MKIGTYYYPEQWPRAQWERDFDNIAAMELRIVHMGEFAWHSMEPAEGNIQLDWLSECVEMAAKRRLEVILCTPTAAPPVWLVTKYPEILPIDDTGRRMRPGHRRHYSPTAPALHDATRRIVTALADRFAQHPSVIGWQIDNEYMSDFIDQNPHAHETFRSWLKSKYGDIDALNRAWANQYCDQYYSDFSQILLPPDRTTRTGNPHQTLDAARFWSHAFAQFNKLQADIIRPSSLRRSVASSLPPTQDSGLSTQNSVFITTNFTNTDADVNPNDLARDLDLMCWDSYPCGGFDTDVSDQCFRMGDPAAIGFMHDYMASFNGRWALMELQPGHADFGETPVHPYPGAVRLWLWTAFAHGAQFTTTSRFRQARFGRELFRHGLVGTDGVTPTLGGRQFQQTIDEIQRLDVKQLAPPNEPADPKRTVGLVFDFDQHWWFSILPQSKRWDYARFVRLWYGALSRLGLFVRVLRPDQDWPADLSLIVAPGLQMVDDALIQKMTAYVTGGGHLVLTCRTALMDRTGQLFEGPTAQPILPLIGGAIEAYDGLPEGAFGTVELDDKEYKWGVWGDMLYTEENTKILAKYANQFYEGAAAVTQRKHESGGICTYCGVFAEQEFTDALAAKLAVQEELTTTPLASRVQLLRRGAYRILLNYTAGVIEAPAPPRTKFAVGSKKVEPAGVAVWREA